MLLTVWREKVGFWNLSSPQGCIWK